MNALVSALASILLLSGTAAHAQELSREQAAQALSKVDTQTRQDAVNRLGEVGTMADATLLVNALRDADEDVRTRAEQAMWRIWARSGDQEVDRLYQVGVEQMSAGDLRQSIATFTNKRATLYFLAGDLRKSLADCDEVMKRNPYHFGALAGYAQIYVRLEYYDRALEYSRRALKINPNMDGVRRNIDLIERLLEQRRRQLI